MYLCIDIGGTKTLIALVDVKGKILHSVKFSTVPNQNDFYSHLLQQIRINFVISGIKAISIAMPGIVKHDKATWLGNLPWQNFDLAKLLKSAFDLPVFVENDANLAALAEAKNHQGRTLYLTLSTGIGGGIVENGQIVKRYQDFEPGHTIYTYNKKAAEWEDIASAHAINNKYNRLVTEITDSAIWNDIVDRICIGLTPLITSIKPDAIIFGGPLGLALPTYRAKLRKRLHEELPANAQIPRLSVARHGHFSVIHGCYLYAKIRQSH